jgi:hypothetical protein
METAYIQPGTAEELHESKDGDVVGGWTRVTDVRGEAHRWSEDHTLIVRSPDGLTWGLDYQVGLTEMQDHEYPWRGTSGPVALTRMYPHVVTSTVYRTEPPAQPASPVDDDGSICG